MLTLAATAPVWGPHMPFVGAALLGPLFLLVPLFWIAVIVVIFALVGRRRRRWMSAYGAGPFAARGAEATLAERFAQGDIDEVEYRARLEVLRANRPAPMH